MINADPVEGLTLAAFLTTDQLRAAGVELPESIFDTERPDGVFANLRAHDRRR
jgi:hypothetical protein